MEVSIDFENKIVRSPKKYIDGEVYNEIREIMSRPENMTYEIPVTWYEEEGTLYSFKFYCINGYRYEQKEKYDTRRVSNNY